MKIWKQLLCVLMALTALLAMAACTPANNETTEPSDTQAQTTASTEELTVPTTEETVPETTEDMTVYSAFIGTWYEGGSDVANRMILADDKTWRYEDATGELLMSGSYSLQEENILSLYNNDAEMVTAIRLMDAENIYMEPCLDIAFELIQNPDFSKTITNSDSMDMEEVIEDLGNSNDSIVESEETAPAE